MLAIDDNKMITNLGMNIVILGDAFMRKYYIAYDKTNNKMGVLPTQFAIKMGSLNNMLLNIIGIATLLFLITLLVAISIYLIKLKFAPNNSGR